MTISVLGILLGVGILVGPSIKSLGGAISQRGWHISYGKARKSGLSLREASTKLYVATRPDPFYDMQKEMGIEPVRHFCLLLLALASEGKFSIFGVPEHSISAVPIPTKLLISSVENIGPDMASFETNSGMKINDLRIAARDYKRAEILIRGECNPFKGLG